MLAEIFGATDAEGADALGTTKHARGDRRTQAVRSPAPFAPMTFHGLLDTSHAWDARDAEDATQEILVKIATRLGGFRGESAVRTWVWRVAANHLLSRRRGRAEQVVHGFECYGSALAALPDEDEPGPEERLLVTEAKIGCTMGMLTEMSRSVAEISMRTARLWIQLRWRRRNASRAARSPRTGLAARYSAQAPPWNPPSIPKYRAPRATPLTPPDPARRYLPPSRTRRASESEGQRLDASSPLARGRPSG